jgi:hypothetical protein
MGSWLSEREQRLVVGAETASAATPIPTQIVSNGEYLPPPQSETQKRVERRIFELADDHGQRLGLSRRQFLQTSCGMAAAFVAMNEIYGSGVFQVAAAEAREPELTQARAQGLAGQFVFDVQTHFVRDDFSNERVLRLAAFAGEHWNPKLKEKAPTLAQYKFQNYVKEVYYDSDTSLALLSGAPFDNPNWWFLSNEQIVKTRELLNDFAGSRRLLAHTIITPKQPGWMEEVDKAITVYKPDSWKAYTIGDPGAPSKYPWRLDDEQVMYPFYEKAVKAGITTICIHKGLLPPDYEKSFAGVWEYATAWDVAKAAKDWPQMTFVIYHSALRPFVELPGQAWAEFEATGRIKWGERSRRDPGKVRRHQRARRARHLLRQFGGGASQVRRGAARHADQGAGRRSRDLGHRLGVVWIAAMADRGDAADRDPRGHAEEIRLRAARRRRQRGQADDLRDQRGAALRPQAEIRAGADAGVFRGPSGRAQARL